MQYDKVTCNLKSKINGSASGFYYLCPSAYYDSSSNNGWSAEGYVKYNINHDGKGALMPFKLRRHMLRLDTRRPESSDR